MKKLFVRQITIIFVALIGSLFSNGMHSRSWQSVRLETKDQGTIRDLGDNKYCLMIPSEGTRRDIVEAIALQIKPLKDHDMVFKIGDTEIKEAYDLIECQPDIYDENSGHGIVIIHYEIK